ncbi:hypothetical protein [Leptolyngbya ohadii]|uniref:hypothetical protein n=1 Tax=Leptolyngbya ohadii TaxID=1962290 RepID=UPI00117B9DBE|nr:hypothetical protein [Leptolyngbya ohadii]
MFAVPAIFKVSQPKFVEILNVILDNLIASGIATVAIAGLIFWLNPPVMRNAEISVLEPRQVSRLLQEGRQSTNTYWFNGGTGRFTRAVTIPGLAASARANNQTTELTIQLIDPCNSELCETYANYRNRLRSAGGKSSWTTKLVQLEVYATIVSAYAYQSSQPLLQVKVGLKQNYSLFRIDLSSTQAIITKEDPQEPALICKAGSLFYHSFLEDMRLSLDQALILPRSSCEKPQFLKVEDVSTLLKNLDIQNADLSEADLLQIIEKVQKLDSPYAGSTR